MEFNLSERFEEERQRIRNQIKNENSITHCNITIDTLEKDVKEFINLLKVDGFELFLTKKYDSGEISAQEYSKMNLLFGEYEADLKEELK